ncbi:MAG: DNA polymerase III [Candidatus Staskawiczbacteria bacterium RIFCSPHIGHO2_02_FULL_34_10]|uniref:DNA-directed DNA polymerase n=1 Tax=Candidatus Staskawiczbacteria bacterium RIFCSPHIGHO2_02_FULL_34_10 TaxID=1802205 RepID=A0A1G2HYI3_9BACT|nr:MAG: DNA polymerase III [Candidatus Staskawiczbacteria bacterium RIFCSPHIGHO2_02_FULL_34_10]
MKNQEIAKIFNEIARFLQIDRVAFKPYAYEKAAFSLESLKSDVSEIYVNGGRKALEEIPGIGKAMSDHIEEYLKTGKVKIYEEFKKKLPVQMDELVRVEGLGPRKVKVLYQKLGVKNLKDLEKAAKKHQITHLFGFGETTEKNILQGVEFLKQNKGRSLLQDIMPVARGVLQKLEGLKEVEKASLAGSLRRRKETIGDVDFLVVSKDSKKVMDFFVSLPGVKKIWGKGKTKASVHMAGGFDMDLRVVQAKSYGAALQYFTGSQDHNIATRRIAIDKGLKLSEYGIFKGPKMIAGDTEEKIYKAINLPYIEPELRENNGEIEAALQGKLPILVQLKDIKGDLHIHSNWEDKEGEKDSIEVLVKKAMDLGYEYIGISDHTKDLKVEKSLNEKQLLEQNKYIKNLNSKFKIQNLKFRILHGCEANIRKDGSIDVDDEVLAQLDYVIAGVHSIHKMEKKEMMARIEKAMKNPNVDILAHPTGRIVNQRDEYQVNFDRMLKLAKETSTILEINSSSRLDLRDFYIRRAKAEGVKMIINTDAHQKEQLNLMEYGVSQARRGWAEKSDIINTLSVEDLLKSLK